MYDSTILAQILWTSTATAGFQVLFTIAFAIVLKVNKIWNFTQPALMGIAFYAMYVVVNPLGGPVFAGVAVALVVTGATASATSSADRLTTRGRAVAASRPSTTIDGPGSWLARILISSAISSPTTSWCSLRMYW